MAKKQRERRYDKYGPLVLMSPFIDGYAMVRRPHCYPGVVTIAEWKGMSVKPTSSKAGETR